MKLDGLEAKLVTLSEITDSGDDSDFNKPSWWSLFARGEFSEALSKVEAGLEENPTCPLSRLAWVRCQLELDHVPITALTSPLEEILADLKSLSWLHPVSASTFLKTALGLAHRNQSRLAITAVERAIDFYELGGSLSSEQWHDVQQFYTKCLSEEIERSELRRENKKYIDSLREKLKSELKRKRISSIPQVKKEEPPTNSVTRSRSRHLNSKSVLRLASENSDETQATSPGKSSQTSEATPSRHIQTENSEKKSVSPKSIAVCVILLLILLGASWHVLFYKKEEKVLSRLAMRLNIPNSSALKLPELDGKEYSGETNSTLAQVGKRLQQLSVQDKTSSENAKPETDATSTENISKDENSEELREITPEEEELESISSLPPARNDIKPNDIPLIDPGKFATTKVEKIGTSPRREEVSPGASQASLEKSPDGRVYGPPKTNDPLQPESGKRALDGSPLRSYEVVQFDPPARFRTIAATEVLAAPSLLATSLAHLEPETPIDVTSRMGIWLELRSKAGKVGYIYAQDAVAANKR